MLKFFARTCAKIPGASLTCACTKVGVLLCAGIGARGVHSFAPGVGVSSKSPRTLQEATTSAAAVRLFVFVSVMVVIRVVMVAKASPKTRTPRMRTPRKAKDENAEEKSEEEEVRGRGARE